jgi:hypothetical protein
MPHAVHSLREITKILMKSHRVVSKYALADLVPMFRTRSLQFCVTPSASSSLTMDNYRFRPLYSHIKSCNRYSAKTGNAEQQQKCVSEKLVTNLLMYYHLSFAFHITFGPKIKIKMSSVDRWLYDFETTWNILIIASCLSCVTMLWQNQWFYKHLKKCFSNKENCKN